MGCRLQGLTEQRFAGRLSMIRVIGGVWRAGILRGFSAATPLMRRRGEGGVVVETRVRESGVRFRGAGRRRPRDVVRRILGRERKHKWY